MAQLIKLLDYITRYESKPFHYPTQYIRLKQDNWELLLGRWEEENELSSAQEMDDLLEDENIEKKRFFKWNFFQKKDEVEADERFIRSLPTSKKQLIPYFLNELLPFQLKWATSTITHTSFTDKNYMYDDTLKMFLQRLPDIYLLMYYPIFYVKNAPVEGEIVLLSPVGIEIITMVKAEHNATIMVSTNRTWEVETDTKTTKMINPTIGLKRTEQVVRSILKRYDIEMTIQKTVIAESNLFLYDTPPYQTNLIGKNEYEGWMEGKKTLHSPLKSIQLKAMEALLRHCQTTAVRRPEWERDDDEFKTVADYEV